MVETTSKPTFEEAYPEINHLVQSRRSAWTYVSLVEWNDVAAILIERIWRKWDLYNPDKESSIAPTKRLEHWVNRLISNALMNMRRDELLRLARPCIGGWNARGKTCVHNLGGDSCEITKSHKQCEECPIYADWKRAREHQLNIKSTVALDNHVQEVSNIQEDFHDYDGIKTALDEAMKHELTHWEYRIYVMLYVQHLKPAKVSETLENLTKTWKRAPREDEQTSYQFVLSKQRWFKELMVEVLRRQGHLDT